MLQLLLFCTTDHTPQKVTKAGKPDLQEVRPRNKNNCRQCQGQRIKVSTLNVLCCDILTHRCAYSVTLSPHSAQISARAVIKSKLCANLMQNGRTRPTHITKVLVKCVSALYVNASLTRLLLIRAYSCTCRKRRLMLLMRPIPVLVLKLVPPPHQNKRLASLTRDGRARPTRAAKEFK